MRLDRAMTGYGRVMRGSFGIMSGREQLNRGSGIVFWW